MGEPQTPHFYDFGIWGRVPEPQNQDYVSPVFVLYLILQIAKFRQSNSLLVFGKDGRRKFPTIRLTKS